MRKYDDINLKILQIFNYDLSIQRLRDATEVSFARLREAARAEEIFLRHHQQISTPPGFRMHDAESRIDENALRILESQNIKDFILYCNNPFSFTLPKATLSLNNVDMPYTEVAVE